MANLPLVDQSGRASPWPRCAARPLCSRHFLTFCPEICPLTSVNLRGVAKALPGAGAASNVQVVEATVEPKRDTVARPATYQALFGADPHWVLATGEQTGREPAVGASRRRSRAGRWEQPSCTPGLVDGSALTCDIQHLDVVGVFDSCGHLR